MRHHVPAITVAVAVALATTAFAREPDWFTRVKEQGLTAACAEEVARHERGVLEDSLHVGDCYYTLERFDEGLAVFRKLTRFPDRNYAALALAKVGEGLFRLDRGAEAKEAFERCLEEHPEAWLDGSVPDLCRAWLTKLGGRLNSPEPEAGESDASEVEKLRREAAALAKRLEELKELIRRLQEK